MRNIGFILMLFLPLQFVSAQSLKPYVLGFETTESIDAVKNNLSTNLIKNGLEVIGEYQPAGDNNRRLLIFTSPDLKNAVKNVGGLTGFAAALRIGITRENGKTLVSYTNPVYWGNAYFRTGYSKVASNYATLTTHLENAMKASGSFKGVEFGSKKGMDSAELHKYHYMFGMPRYDDNVELGTFDSHQAAISKMNSSIAKGVPGVKKVYEVTIPGKNLRLYGFALSGADGEGKFMPIIDISSPKHTAFLPYEVLVMDNQVLMLHGRYRIALSFPDLTMGTFTKIMSTPGNIKDLLGQLVK